MNRQRAGIKDCRFRDLRHCAITNMRKAGIDPFTIMKFTGHKSLSMVKRYNTVDQVDGQEGAKKLAGFFAAKKEVEEINCKSTALGGRAGEERKRDE